jgi:hypothetical protein
MGAVILDRARIDHAAAREGEAGLPLQPGNFVGKANPQWMRTVRCHRIEHRCRVGLAHWTECDAPLRRRDFDHWFQPVQSARTGSDDLDRNPAFARDEFQHQRHVIGADRDRAGIA